MNTQKMNKTNKKINFVIKRKHEYKKLPWDLRNQIWNRVNAHYYVLNTYGMLGVWKEDGFKVCCNLNLTQLKYF